MTSLALILRKLRSLLRLAPFELAWLFPVWVVLGLSRLVILLFSFKRMAPWLGVPNGATPWVPLLDDLAQSRANHIRRVVQLVARYTPWESNCFPQAVTARVLLGIYGIPYVLFFGLARDTAGKEQAMKAHAWVAAGKVRVTGGASFGQFAVVACFMAPPLARSMQNSC